MNRVTHFEIPSDNPESSMKFYSSVFGWTYQKFGDQPYWLVNTGEPNEPGINGGIMKKNHPQQPVTNSIQVKDINASLKKIEEAGGKVVVPVTPIPGIGSYAYFTDLDGNIFGVMQEA